MSAACCAFQHEHPVWSVDHEGDAPKIELGADRIEIFSLQDLLVRAQSAPRGEARVDAICALGKSIVGRFSGPGSLVERRPGWRTVLLNKFACWRHEIDRTGGRLYDNDDGSERLSAAARRRFRGVARELIARLAGFGARPTDIGKRPGGTVDWRPVRRNLFSL